MSTSVAFSSSALLRAVRCRLATSFHASQASLVSPTLAASASRPRLSVCSCVSSSLALLRRYCSSCFCRCVEFLGLTSGSGVCGTDAVGGRPTSSAATPIGAPPPAANHASRAAKKSSGSLSDAPSPPPPPMDSAATRVGLSLPATPRIPGVRNRLLPCDSIANNLLILCVNGVIISDEIRRKVSIFEHISCFYQYKIVYARRPRYGLVSCGSNDGGSQRSSLDGSMRPQELDEISPLLHSAVKTANWQARGEWRVLTDGLIECDHANAGMLSPPVKNQLERCLMRPRPVSLASAWGLPGATGCSIEEPIAPTRRLSGMAG